MTFTLTALSSMAQAAPRISGNSFAIRDVRIFDGTRVLDRGNVVVRDGIIRGVGTDVDIPSDLEAIDGSGKTLLPGLIDSHTHSQLEPLMASELKLGVTTELDMFTPVRFAARQRSRRVSMDRTTLADMWSAGTLATSPGGQNAVGTGIPTISGADEAERFVQARIAEGSDYIKIVYEPGIPNFTTISRQTLAALIASAHQQGRLAIVHVSSLQAARDAVALGADGLMHLFRDAVIDDDLLDLMVEKDVFVVPTLSVILAVYSDEQPGKALASDARLAPYLLPAQRRSLSASRPELPASMMNVDPQNARTSIARLQAAGIDILAGSDAPNPGTAHGATLHGELAELVRSGLTPVQALAAATRIPAERFGLADRGRIAEGLRADLVMVEDDPTSDITATRAITRVFKNGFELDRSP